MFEDLFQEPEPILGVTYADTASRGIFCEGQGPVRLEGGIAALSHVWAIGGVAMGRAIRVAVYDGRVQSICL